MKLLLNRIKIFIILLIFVLAKNASAEIYRLANRKPNSFGDFFSGTLGSKVNFGSFGDISLWILILIWLFLFIVIWKKGFDRIGIDENPNVPWILSAITATIAMSSPYIAKVTLIGGIATVAAVIIFIFVSIVRGIRGSKPKLKNIRDRLNRRRLKLLIGINKKLRDILGRTKKADPDDEDYDDYVDGLSKDIDSIRNASAKLNRIFRRVAVKHGRNRDKKIIRKSFGKIESYLSKAENKLKDNNPKAAHNLIRNASKLLNKLTRAIYLMLRRIETKKTKPKPDEPPKEREPETDEPEPREPPKEREPEPGETPPVNRAMDNIKIGEVYGYKSNRGLAMFVEVKAKDPEKNIVQVKNVSGGPAFAINPEQLSDVERGGPKAIENLKNYYDNLRYTAESLPPDSKARIEVEKTAIKIMKQLEKYGYKPA